MMRFGPLKPDVKDLGDCDFNMIIYEDLGMCFIEKDLDSPNEYLERFKWDHWSTEDYNNAIEILRRLKVNAERVGKKLEARRDAILVEEEKAKHPDLPKPGDILYIPSSDDVFGGKAIVNRLHFHVSCKNETNRVFVSFKDIFENGLTFNLKILLEEQESLKKTYGEEVARVVPHVW